MKARTIALVLLLSAVTVCAQTPAPTKKLAPATTQAKPAVPAAAPSPAAKPAAVKPATPSPAAKPAAVKPATPSPAAKPAAAKPAVPAQAKAAAPVAKPAKPAVAKAAKPAAKRVKPAVAKAPATMAKAKPKGKRDPFVSPIVHSEGVVACATGKKCLPVDSIVLKGIVKSQAGMIAVVEGSSRKISYFLRENDPVFNGYVVKITRDSVVFRENVIDPVGRQSTRDVVKKVVAPVV